MKTIFNFFSYVVIFFSFLSILIIVFISSIQINVLSNILQPQFKYTVITIFPESFAFFTKDPKDEQMMLYFVKEENDKIKKVNLKNNSAYNYFGFSRKSRRLTYELGSLIKRVPDSLWNEITESEIKELDFKGKAFLLKKDNNVKLFEKGKYILYYFKPIQWEWNDLKEVTNGKYVYISIE